MIDSISKSNRAQIILGALALVLLTALVLGRLTPSPVEADPPHILYSVSPFDANLRTINPDTAATESSVAITLVGNTVFGANGLAEDPTTGVLWALLRVSGGSGRVLVTLHPVTGVASIVGSPGLSFASIAFIANGTLYGVTGDGETPPETLFVLDKNYATATIVLSLGSGSAGETIGYSFDRGRIYHASGMGDPNVDETLESIHPGTLSLTNVPLSGDDYHEAFAMTDGGSSFLLADFAISSTGGNLYDVSYSGEVRLIGAMDHWAIGLAYLGHTSIPDPVGGITSFQTRESGSSFRGFALLVGGAAAVVAIASLGWYAGRRWPGNRSG